MKYNLIFRAKQIGKKFGKTTKSHINTGQTYLDHQGQFLEKDVTEQKIGMNQLKNLVILNLFLKNRFPNIESLENGVGNTKN